MGHASGISAPHFELPRVKFTAVFPLKIPDISIESLDEHQMCRWPLEVCKPSHAQVRKACFRARDSEISRAEMLNKKMAASIVLAGSGLQRLTSEAGQTCLSVDLRYVYIYIYIYMYTCTHIDMYMCVYTYIYIYIHMYTYICIYIYIYTYRS